MDAVNKDKSKAITSLVLGALFFVPLFNVFFGIIGLIFGVLALKEMKFSPEQYGDRWMAVAGIVLCLIPLIGGLFYMGEKILLSQ